MRLYLPHPAKVHFTAHLRYADHGPSVVRCPTLQTLEVGHRSHLWGMLEMETLLSLRGLLHAIHAAVHRMRRGHAIVHAGRSVHLLSGYMLVLMLCLTGVQRVCLVAQGTHDHL